MAQADTKRTSKFNSEMLSERKVSIPAVNSQHLSCLWQFRHVRRTICVPHDATGHIQCIRSNFSHRPHEHEHDHSLLVEIQRVRVRRVAVHPVVHDVLRLGDRVAPEWLALNAEASDGRTRGAVHSQRNGPPIAVDARAVAVP